MVFTAMIADSAYSVRPVSADPPRFAVFDSQNRRCTAPVPADERERAEAIAELCNEVRRLALEERRNGSPHHANKV